MSILIKTQDRKMTVLVDSYYFEETYYCKDQIDAMNYMLGRTKEDYKRYVLKGFISSQRNEYKKDFVLGIYTSEEKAKRVLERINDRVIMIDRTKFFGCENANYVDCIFEMPLDEEVKV